MGAGECKASACKPADPTADTVKVDGALLTEPHAQTLTPPAEGPDAEELRRKEEEAEAARLEQQRRQEAEEEEQRQAACAEQKRLGEERLEQERLLQEERKRQEREAEEKRRAEERAAEEARIRAEEEAAEKARQEADKAAKAAEAARQKAGHEMAQKKTEEYLKARGFKSATVPRKSFCGGAVYPLHLAVEEKNVEVVQALVRCGADKGQKDSSGKTPQEVAVRCNKGGSHDRVLAALGA